MKTEQTLTSWNHYWLDLVRPHIRESTAIKYQRAIDRIIDPCIGNTPLSKVNEELGIQFVKQELSGNRGRSQICLAVTVLKMSIDQACEEGLCLYNPFRLLKLPKWMHKETSILYADDIRKLMTEYTELPCTPLFVIVFLLCLRIGEALGLKWSEVDFEKGQVFICRQRNPVEQDGHTVDRLVEWTKNGVKDTVCLDEFAISWLQIQKERQAQWEQQHPGKYANPEGYVFTTPLGDPLSYSAVEYQFRKLMAKIGRNDVTLHSLRHTAASVAFSTTGNRLFVLEFLRNHSLNTFDIYVQPTYQQQAAFAQALHNEFSPLIRCAVGEEFCHV